MALSAFEVSKNIALVDTFLQDLEHDLEHIRVVDAFEGTLLADICRDHAKQCWYFKSRLTNLKTLESFLSIDLERIEGTLFKEVQTTSRLKLTPTEIKMYVQSDDEYIMMRKLIVQVVALKMKYDAAYTAVESMQWQLTNLTKLRVAMLEDAVV